jgi:hypothetical protein
MPSAPNVLRWDGKPGHYEVYYVTLTDPASGIGAWIRYTMVAPLERSGEPPSASLWFLTMDPNGGVLGRKATFPADALRAASDPFELRIGEAVLTDSGMEGSFEDVAWDLRWVPGRSYETVHPLLRRVASTILVLPHADVALEGTISFGGRTVQLAGARGGQAHLWGSKHAGSWAWTHCNDFTAPGGEPAAETFVDGVSVFVSRFGRTVGPNTPVVGRIEGRDFYSTAPLRVLSNQSDFELARWRFEAVAGSRKLVGEVEAEPRALAGVTYHDPDGELAYCYNSETASMRLELYERAGFRGPWRHRTTLSAPGRAHFEYAARTPAREVELVIE